MYFFPSKHIRLKEKCYNTNIKIHRLKKAQINYRLIYGVEPMSYYAQGHLPETFYGMHSSFWWTRSSC